MPDLIDQAVNVASGALGGVATGALGGVASGANSALGAASAAADKLNSLPLDKDPETIQREKEAKIQQKKAEVDEKLSKAEEVAVEEAKKKLATLAIGVIASIPLPIIDPKIIAGVALLKQAKEAIKNRKKRNKENLEKGRELYRYDMKPIKKPISTGIQIPTPPTLPNVPNLPTI